jgi:hypothetical protein
MSGLRMFTMSIAGAASWLKFAAQTEPWTFFTIAPSMAGIFRIIWNANWGWIVTCDLCGLELEAGETPAGHVWIRHVPGYVCWCGLPLDDDVDGVIFGRHCAVQGGVLAHYLECQLGSFNG